MRNRSDAQAIAIAVAAALLAACQQQVAIRVDREVPAALVERLPVSVGVRFPGTLAAHEYVEQSPGRGSWRIASGDSQVAMFRRVLGDLFDDVREVAPGAAADTALLLEPRLTAMQFATPGETGFDYYESWIEYEVVVRDASGTALTPWRFSGYGQAPAALIGGLDEGLADALGEALRNAGARLATGLPEHPPVAAFLAQDGAR